MAQAQARTISLPKLDAQQDVRSGSVLFIGTATLLIRYAGFTILTDPNFLHRHERIGVGYGLHATRLTDPALDIADLPPLDLVVLSHLHEDHFDRVAERDLDKRLPIVTTPQAAAALTKKGFRAMRALKTWERLVFAKGDVRLQITSMPGRHGPGILAKALPEVMGSVLEFQSPEGATLLRVYITGDTLLYDQLREIPRRYPDIDLGFFHLGGTRILGLMLTMDAKQGAAALKLIAPKTAIPIHYNDYDIFASPLSDFQRAVIEAGWEGRVVYLGHGETYQFDVPEDRPS